MFARVKRKQHRREDLLAIVTFMAFAIEAYINNLGARYLKIWDELERLPWVAKINILHKTAGRPIDWGREPLQFARRVFTIRDRLAHGKPERVFGPLIDTDTSQPTDGAETIIQPDWYSEISEEWILDSEDRFNSLMGYLGGLFNQSSTDYLRLSSSGVLTDGEVKGTERSPLFGAKGAEKSK